MRLSFGIRAAHAALVAIVFFATLGLSLGQETPTDVLTEALRARNSASDTAEHVRIAKTTADFSVVVEQVHVFVRQHGEKNVLLVIDLDNTLLAMNQDLGSDQWFNWQESLLKENPRHPDLVALDFSGLLESQGILFALSSMHPPQPDLPKLINGLAKEGLGIFVLTSRGKEFRDSSRRELIRNGYNFQMTAPKIVEKKRGAFEPYDKCKPDAHGLNAEIIAELGVPRPVTYADGIYMTSGQHKGYLLRTLLARTNRSIKSNNPLGGYAAIVFVDDREKHTKRVHEAFVDKKINLATFRYSREDGNVDKFEKSSKEHVIRDWNLLKAFTKTVLVK